MAVTLTARKRKFVVDGKELVDPAPGQPLTRAIKLLVLSNPSLGNAEYNSRVEGEYDIYEFSKKTGTYA